MGACSPQFYPDNNEYLLYLQVKSGNKAIPTYDLEPYFKQRPNKRVLGVRLSLFAYYFGKQFWTPEATKTQLDTLIAQRNLLLASDESTKKSKKLKKLDKKIRNYEKNIADGNWVMRAIGSKPVVYDSSLAMETVAALESFYRARGYFDAQVLFDTDTLLYNIIAKYNFVENLPYKIDTLKVDIKERNLKRLFNEYLEDSKLKKGDILTEQNLLSERDRIEKLYKKNGYYLFNKNFISFLLDTAQHNVIVELKVNIPDNSEAREVYKMGESIFYIDSPDLGNDSTTSPRYFSTIQDKSFYSFERKYKSYILDSRIRWQSGQKYNIESVQQTIRNLNQLESFKFVNIQMVKDTTNNKLYPIIRASSTSKYQLSDELGMSVSQGLPGPFGSISFASRNVFGGFEVFDVNLRGGIEGVASASNPSNVYRSYEVGANTGLTFPRLFTVLRFNRLFINYNPRTKFTASYNYLLRPEYLRTNIRFSSTYYISPNRFKQFSLSLLDLNLVTTPFIEREFGNYLNKSLLSGNNLFRSFQNAVVSNINSGYSHNTFDPSVNKESFFYRLYAESGGTSLNLIPIQQQDRILGIFGTNIKYIYWKLGTEGRYYLPITKGSYLANRVQVGIASPYAGSGVLPYEKYFFTGGTNSNRAWLPRRLGPGSSAVYGTNEDGTTNFEEINYSFEQPGTILFELNTEYRYKIYRYIEGAHFIDAGNVWLQESQDPKKRLKSDSYRELGIGMGAGIRLNFSFLVVRLDLGLKVHDPARPEGQRWVIERFSLAKPLSNRDLYLFNIAIGYPF